MGNKMEPKRSEAVLRLSKQLNELQVGIKGDRWGIEYRLFIIAGLSLEALSQHLEELENRSELPSGWPAQSGTSAESK